MAHMFRSVLETRSCSSTKFDELSKPEIPNIAAENLRKAH
jgi:hypothetical protein